MENELQKALSFVRAFVRVKWDLDLSDVEQITKLGENGYSISIDVRNVGKNILFDEFMRKVKISFRLTENEYGIHLWGLDINFEFKTGGRNGWSHDHTFALVNGNFIER